MCVYVSVCEAEPRRLCVHGHESQHISLAQPCIEKHKILGVGKRAMAVGMKALERSITVSVTSAE